MQTLKMKPLATNTQVKEKDTQFIRHVLLQYKKYGRHDLPWRTSITPYKILVSEIMLQQTQVSRVLPKYKLWLKQYPSLKSLKNVPFRAILSLWQGLGYQRRAKALFELGQELERLPKAYEELVKLKGIGPYTASAICAFAYDSFPPRLLETNIRTALIEEFHQGETEIHDGILYDDLARLEKNMRVQKIGARAWYYALMDYGAHLKSQKISHNQKSTTYAKQSPYVGSIRQLRAKILFSVMHGEALPQDERAHDVLQRLVAEGYIVKKGARYRIA